MPTTERVRRRRRRVFLTAVALAVVVASATTFQASWAAWNATAVNGPSGWHTGTVSFGPNQPAASLLTIANVFPGSFGSSCVRLTYTGTLTAPVRLYLATADLGGTGLGTYLTLRVREGSGSSSDCSDFTSSGSLYNPTGLTATSYTLAAFSTTASTYATGVGTWTASPSDPTRTYRFDWQVQDKNAAQSRTALPSFTWEAQTT
jgi:hypothetical protein